MSNIGLKAEMPSNVILKGKNAEDCRMQSKKEATHQK